MSTSSRFLLERVQATIWHGQALVRRGLQDAEHRSLLRQHASDLDHLSVQLRTKARLFDRRLRRAADQAEAEALGWRQLLSAVA